MILEVAGFAHIYAWIYNVKSKINDLILLQNKSFCQ